MEEGWRRVEVEVADGGQTCGMSTAGAARPGECRREPWAQDLPRIGAAIALPVPAGPTPARRTWTPRRSSLRTQHEDQWVSVVC